MYFLDGYNILFTLTESKHPLATQRSLVIQFLQRQFALRKISGLLVFDGVTRSNEESGRAYPSPLEIVYTPAGQSADSYIIEHIECSKNPRQITVVTNDGALSRNARALEAKTMKNKPFIQWLEKRNKKKQSEKTPPKESKHHFERLLKIFENKIKEPE